MFRWILFWSLCTFVVESQDMNAGRSVYGPLSFVAKKVVDPRITAARDSVRQQYQQARSREISSSFVQSRRFHKDQAVRNSALPFPAQPSNAAPAFAVGHYAYGSNVVGSSQEGCRLTNNFCARDYQCCSGKCRCVRWSVMGKMSCHKKCY